MDFLGAIIFFFGCSTPDLSNLYSYIRFPIFSSFLSAFRFILTHNCINLCPFCFTAGLWPSNAWPTALCILISCWVIDFLMKLFHWFPLLIFWCSGDFGVFPAAELHTTGLTAFWENTGQCSDQVGIPSSISSLLWCSLCPAAATYLHPTYISSFKLPFSRSRDVP